MSNTLLRDPDTVAHAFTIEFADGTDQEVAFWSRRQAEDARAEALELQGPDVTHISHVYRQDKF